MGGIEPKDISIYDAMNTAFQSYICEDDITGIRYDKMGIFMQNDLDIEGYVRKLRYTLPKMPIEKGSEIVLYGAGSVGKDYYTYLKTLGEYNIVAWVDKKGNNLGNGEIVEINALLQLEYDYILIAVLNKNVADEIKQDLMNIGVKQEKIFWGRPRLLNGMILIEMRLYIRLLIFYRCLFILTV